MNNNNNYYNIYTKSSFDFHSICKKYQFYIIDNNILEIFVIIVVILLIFKLIILAFTQNVVNFI